MRNLKKTIALAVMISLLIGITAISVSAEPPGKISVSLRIEGVEETLYYDKAIEIAAGSTIEDLMVLANELDDAIGIVITGDPGETYIPEIAGLAQGTHGGYSGWSVMVNNIAPTVGQSQVELFDGDIVVYYYGDPWGEPGMQYPSADLSKIYSDGKISFTSDDAEYDEEWNVSLVRNPVVGATVNFAGKVYITDDNGEITIEDMAGIAGMQGLTIDRFDSESGVPTVLRFAPDFLMYVPFADTPADIWYEIPVMYCVNRGLFIGTDAAANAFSPMKNMTMAELVTVLGRIAGEDFSAPSTPWYASARDWAVDNDIVEEDSFDAGASVTRETFIYMFYLTAGLVGTYDMTVSADISTATDYDEINDGYLDAVAWAVASDIIHGTSGAALTISPDVEVNRATVCQMLLNYYN